LRTSVLPSGFLQAETGRAQLKHRTARQENNGDFKLSAQQTKGSHTAHIHTVLFLKFSFDPLLVPAAQRYTLAAKLARRVLLASILFACLVKRCWFVQGRRRGGWFFGAGLWNREQAVDEPELTTAQHIDQIPALVCKLG
jgi:hypothetical protein